VIAKEGYYVHKTENITLDTWTVTGLQTRGRPAWAKGAPEALLSTAGQGMLVYLAPNRWLLWQKTPVFARIAPDMPALARPDALPILSKIYTVVRICHFMRELLNPGQQWTSGGLLDSQATTGARSNSGNLPCAP